MLGRLHSLSSSLPERVADDETSPVPGLFARQSGESAGGGFRHQDCVNVGSTQSGKLDRALLCANEQPYPGRNGLGAVPDEGGRLAARAFKRAQTRACGMRSCRLKRKSRGKSPRGKQAWRNPCKVRAHKTRRQTGYRQTRTNALRESAKKRGI